MFFVQNLHRQQIRRHLYLKEKSKQNPIKKYCYNDTTKHLEPYKLYIQNEKTILFACFGLLMLGLTSCGHDNEPEVSSSEGALSGVFSVSATKTVRFSKGNLQYRASTKTWRFAEHQYDYIGDSNKNISVDYSEWIDLFGFGTANQPTVNTNDNSYYATGLANGFVNDLAQSPDYDWGWANPISNGGNKVHQWRTLTREEMQYLLFTRPNADQFCTAVVHGVHGMVIVPDKWEVPAGVDYVAKARAKVFSDAEWMLLEAAGAVFFPEAGMRDYDANTEKMIVMKYVGERGYYWTGSSPTTYRAVPLIFDDATSVLAYNAIPKQNNYAFALGLSVRLVKDVK